MSNVLFAVWIIYDSGSRRCPSTSWSSFRTMTQSLWMCRYVLTLVCPSRISSPPPVQLFIRVNIRDGSSCCVTQTLQCSCHHGGAQLDKSPCAPQWPVLDFHTTFTDWSNHIYMIICLVKLNLYFKTDVKLCKPETLLKMLRILVKCLYLCCICCTVVQLFLFKNGFKLYRIN